MHRFFRRDETSYAIVLIFILMLQSGQPVTQQQSTTGTTPGNLFSNVSGGAAPSRFRVIEVTRSRFAVVEGRSENIVAAGFESSKAAWA